MGFSWDFHGHLPWPGAFIHAENLVLLELQGDAAEAALTRWENGCFMGFLNSIGWFFRENYMNLPYFMGKSMVSCRFSLKSTYWLSHDWLMIHHIHTSHQLDYMNGSICLNPLLAENMMVSCSSLPPWINKISSPRQSFTRQLGIGKFHYYRSLDSHNIPDDILSHNNSYSYLLSTHLPRE